jgi:drug/metabolite transporter (DMT)-like permease
MAAKGGATPSPGGTGPAAGNGRLFTVGLVTAWYSSNIGVLLLNKYLLSNYGFKYPIFLTMCHMSACALLSYAAIAWLRVVPMQLVRSRVQLAKIAALSLVFCGSVVSGNVSLRYLPVSFNQAVGATTPFFTAVFAYVMTVKRESWVTYLTLVPVVTGVIIASGVSYSAASVSCFLSRSVGVGIGSESGRSGMELTKQQVDLSSTASVSVRWMVIHPFVRNRILGLSDGNH